MGLADIPMWVPNSMVVSEARERAAEYKIDMTVYSDAQILDFVKFVPQDEADAFRKSYDLRPNVGDPKTPESVARNYREFHKQKTMLRDMVKSWRKNCEATCRLKCSRHRQPFKPCQFCP